MKDFPGVHWQAQKQPNLFSYPVSVPAQHFPLLLPAEAFRAPRGVWDVPPHPEISITAAGVLMPLGTLALGKAQASPHSPWLSVPPSQPRWKSGNWMHRHVNTQRENNPQKHGSCLPRNSLFCAHTQEKKKKKAKL